MKKFTTNHTEREEFLTTNETNAHEREKIIYRGESYEINSCIYEVNRKLGVGFLEAVYQEALEIELRRKNISFVSKINELFGGYRL